MAIKTSEAEQENLKVRVEYVERSVKKGLIARKELDAEREKLAKVEVELKKLREDRTKLGAPAEAKKVAEAEKELDRIERESKAPVEKARAAHDSSHAAVLQAKKALAAIRKEIEQREAAVTAVAPMPQPRKPDPVPEVPRPIDPLAAGLAHCKAAIDAHPERSGGYLFQAVLAAAAEQSNDRVLAAYSEAAKRSSNPDPILDVIAAEIGSNNLVAFAGLDVWTGLAMKGKDGSALLDRIIAQLGPNVDPTVLEIFRDEKELDFSVVRRHMASGGVFFNDAEKQKAERDGVRKVLQRIEARLPERPAADEVSLRLLMLFYGASLVFEQDSKDLDGVARVGRRFLKMTAFPDPPAAVIDDLSKLRAEALMLLSFASFQSDLNKEVAKSGVLDEKKMRAFTDRMEAAVRAKDAAQGRIVLRDGIVLIRAMIETMQTVMRNRTVQIRSEVGTLAGVGLDMLFALMMKKIGQEFAGGAGALAFQPGTKDKEFFELLKDTPEMKEFEAIFGNLPAQLWGDKRIDAIWKECLGNIRSKSDAALMLSYLIMIEKFATETDLVRKNDPDLEEYRTMQAELRLRLRTGQYYQEADAEPTTPEATTVPDDATTPITPDNSSLLIWIGSGTVVVLLTVAIILYVRHRGRRKR